MARREITDEYKEALNRIYATKFNQLVEYQKGRGVNLIVGSHTTCGGVSIPPIHIAREKPIISIEEDCPLPYDTGEICVGYEESRPNPKDSLICKTLGFGRNDECLIDLTVFPFESLFFNHRVFFILQDPITLPYLYHGTLIQLKRERDERDEKIKLIEKRNERLNGLVSGSSEFERRILEALLEDTRESSLNISNEGYGQISKYFKKRIIDIVEIESFFEQLRLEFLWGLII